MDSPGNDLAVALALLFLIISLGIFLGNKLGTFISNRASSRHKTRRP